MRRHRKALEIFHAKGYDDLATYNSEVSRGIVHTETYDARMAAIQQQFNAEWFAKAEAEGWVIVGGDTA